MRHIMRLIVIGVVWSALFCRTKNQLYCVAKKISCCVAQKKGRPWRPPLIEGYGGIDLTNYELDNLLAGAYGIDAGGDVDSELVAVDGASVNETSVHS